MVTGSRRIDQLIQFRFVDLASRPHEFGKRRRPGLAVQREVFLNQFAQVALRRHSQSPGFACQFEHSPWTQTFEPKCRRC